MATDTANESGNTFPNRVCNGQLTNWTLTHYFDTTCFPGPPTYTFGNSGRNVIYGPKLANNIDFGLHRRIKLPVHENTNLELRAEAFNFLNHPQFSDPNVTIGSPAVNTISATGVANRIIQVAARITW
jgi:hypothetical protein